MRATRLLVLSCCVVAICASARPVAVDSVIRGVVTDPGGTPISGALVRATNATGAKSLSRYTSVDGRYELTVAPGQYGVVAEAFGFGPERRSIGIAADTAVNFTLAPDWSVDRKHHRTASSRTRGEVLSGSAI